MKRTIAFLLVVAACMVVAPRTMAQSAIDANTFATDPAYCGSSGFTLEKTLVVQGGTGALPGSCKVTLGEKAHLKIVNATLTGPGFFRADDGTASKVDIKQSSITMVGSVQLLPGDAPGEDKGRLQIIGSTIVSTGSGLFLAGSLNSLQGNVQIKDSTIRTDADEQDVVVRASGGSPSGRGKIQVSNSELSASGGVVDIQAGDLQVKKATFFGDAFVSANGGKCKVQDSTPSTVACSP